MAKITLIKLSLNFICLALYPLNQILSFIGLKSHFGNINLNSQIKPLQLCRNLYKKGSTLFS